jgi:hypothetical protein
MLAGMNDTHVSPLTATTDAGGCTIQTGGELVVHARRSARGRPCLHPIRSPHGAVLTEDEPPHHRWQHGVSTGLNDVDGVGFWCEGLLPDHAPNDGTIRMADPAMPIIAGNRATWTLDAAWRDRTGGAVLDERQAWRLDERADCRVLDLAWELTAARDLRFGAYDYGGVFVRMPWRQGMEARLLSSQGPAARPEDLDGRALWWMALALPIGPGGAWAGLALGVRPSRSPWPPPWRCDSTFGFGPARCRAGAWRLAQGATHREDLRLVAFDGPGDVAALDAIFQESAP